MAHTNKTEPWFVKQRNPEFRLDMMPCVNAVTERGYW